MTYNMAIVSGDHCTATDTDESLI